MFSERATTVLLSLHSAGVLSRHKLSPEQESAAEQRFAIHAYCVMPDHVHLLVEGMVETCDLVRFISSFKQQTAFYYKKKIGRRLWQSSYYDHILRKPVAANPVAWYTGMNPVRI